MYLLYCYRLYLDQNNNIICFVIIKLDKETGKNIPLPRKQDGWKVYATVCLPAKKNIFVLLLYFHF